MLIGDRIDDVVEVVVLVQVTRHQRADGDDAFARRAGRLQGFADQDGGQPAAFVAVRWLSWSTNAVRPTCCPLTAMVNLSVVKVAPNGGGAAAAAAWPAAVVRAVA